MDVEVVVEITVDSEQIFLVEPPRLDAHPPKTKRLRIITANNDFFIVLFDLIKLFPTAP